MEVTSAALDRLAMRGRPQGDPLMRQNWENLLFLHWAFDPKALAPLIPLPLELDLFEDKAWLGITPFRVTGMKLSALPEIPGFTAFEELNVRTYVHYKGMPGVYFLSLDVSKFIPAIGVRMFYGLPYFHANIETSRRANEFTFDLSRTSPREAHFHAHWMKGIRLQDPSLDSLAFFLVERYALFTVQNNKVEMTRIYHHPWILDEARVLKTTSTMLNPLGLTDPASEPLAHFSSVGNVEIWPPQAL